jgi:hypothetical protein
LLFSCNRPNAVSNALTCSASVTRPGSAPCGVTRGLRGAGRNFGVVTSLEYRLHPMNPMILGGILNWPAARMREVLEFYAEYAPRKPDELCM